MNSGWWAVGGGDKGAGGGGVSIGLFTLLLLVFFHFGCRFGLVVVECETLVCRR